MAKTVAIIGAGIVGVSTALWSQRAGHKVILIDREGPAAGTSYGNGGVLASIAVVPVSTPGLLRAAPRMLFDKDQPLFLKWRYALKLAPYMLKFLRYANAGDAQARAQAMVPIIGDSLADHQALSQGTPAARYVVPTDYAFIYDDRAAFERDEFAWNLRKQLGFRWDTLEGQAFRDFDPVFSPDKTFAVRCPDHGRIPDPGAYVTALADHAVAEGATFLKGEVSDIVRENGAVTGVRVGGETVPCDAAVIATGAWSTPLAKKLGVSIPLETERGYHLELWEPNKMPRVPVMVASGKFVATPMDGRLRLAGVVEFGGLKAPASRAPIELLERSIREAIPGIEWKERKEWMGHRPAIADSTPVIGEVAGTKGAFMAFGHDHVGLTGGPKTGRLVSQLVSGVQPNIDMRPYDPGRFAS